LAGFESNWPSGKGADVRKDEAQPPTDEGRKAAPGNAIFLIAGSACCLLLFALMAAITWRRWPDVLVDFGRDEYIAWQMLHGKVLYRDIAYLFGPLTPAFNALIAGIFGVSCTTFFLTNLVMLALFLAVLWGLMARATSCANAFLCVAVVILVFGFARYAVMGNFNFISPYTAAATHGTILAALLIYLLCRGYERPDSRWIAALSGFVFGLVLLTRAEVGVAAALAVGAFVVIGNRYVRKRGITLGAVGAFCISALTPLALFLIYFASRMSLREAVAAVANPWILLSHREVWANCFYRRGMGMDDPFGNLKLMVRDAALVTAAVVALLAVSRSIWRPGAGVWGRILGILFAVGLACSAFWISPYEAGRPLPLLCAEGLVLLTISWWRTRKESPSGAHQDAVLILWAAFSIGLLGKMLLFARLYQYGFYLGLPAVVFVCSMAFWYVPARLGKGIRGMAMYRAVVLFMVLAVAARCVWLTWTISRYETFEIGAGSDMVRTYDPQLDWRGGCIAQVLEWLRRNTSDRNTLTVLPEGICINYWARRVNPIRITNCQMTEILLFGEDAILQDLRDHAPDYFLLVRMDASDYGVGDFGMDPRYGMKIMDWIETNYAPVRLFSAEPPHIGGVTMLLMSKVVRQIRN
jgi:hypothetical protein